MLNNNIKLNVSDLIYIVYILQYFADKNINMNYKANRK